MSHISIREPYVGGYSTADASLIGFRQRKSLIIINMDSVYRMHLSFHPSLTTMKSPWHLQKIALLMPMLV